LIVSAHNLLLIRPAADATRWKNAEAMSAQPAIDQAHAAIVFADDAAQLAQVRRPGVQAVIFAPARRACWEAELAATVECRTFVIERCSLMIEHSDALAHVLEHRLPQDGLQFETRLALVDDLAALADRLASIAGCRGLMVRLFTESPTEHCGFHVDTVAPGRPPIGLLKVYNGQGTHYIDPADVTRMHDFYGYLGRRERLVRECHRALDEGYLPDAERPRSELEALDAAPPFLRPFAQVKEVPAGATVAFRHLDVREHWSEHSRERPWIHCSPMAGVTRLVANFTPLDGPAGQPP
jgi:hypothetical protein